MTADKQCAHAPADRVPADPVDRALATAPVEDEEISEEEGQAVARSKEWFQHNQGIPFVRAGRHRPRLRHGTVP